MIEHDYTLSYGANATPGEGRCAMEWVSWIAGEQHSDSPTCVSHLLRAVGIGINDTLNDIDRQLLRPYLTRMIGTAGDGKDGARMYTVLDWSVREMLPFRAARWVGEDAIAEVAQSVDPINDLGSALRALSALRCSSSRINKFNAMLALRRLGSPSATTASIAERALMEFRVNYTNPQNANKRAELYRSAFAMLDRILPKVMIDLPAPVADRARALEAVGR
jgi:hypothetical protein